MSRFRVLFEAGPEAANLPEQLRVEYGSDLAFPDPFPDRPYTATNFVTTMDGVVAYGGGHGGSEGRVVSRGSADDQWLLGLLRGCADCVMVGAGTLRAEPGHTWTTGALTSAPHTECSNWRESAGRPANPIQCFVTGSGQIDLDSAVFHREDLRSVVFTTPGGAAEMSGASGHNARIVVVGTDQHLDLSEALRILRTDFGVRLLVCEGGPHLFGQMMTDGLVDECFQTISPVLAGSDASGRLSLLEGTAFTPAASPVFALQSVRTGIADTNHLFVRYVRQIR